MNTLIVCKSVLIAASSLLTTVVGIGLYQGLVGQTLKRRTGPDDLGPG
jgi:hypothetical protein